MDNFLMWHREIRAQDLRRPDGSSPYPISVLVDGEWLHPDGRITPDRIVVTPVSLDSVEWERPDDSS